MYKMKSMKTNGFGAACLATKRRKNAKRGAMLTLLALLAFVQGAWAQSTFGGGSGTVDDPYLISTKENWDALAVDVNNGITYSGVYFKQTAQIFPGKMIGNSDENSFQGIYDGNGYEISGILRDSFDEYSSPFRFVKNATIKRVFTNVNANNASNLWYNTFKHGAGLVGRSTGNTQILNCVVGTRVPCFWEGEAYNGGIVSEVASGTLIIDNCLFNGRFLGSTSTTNGGFVGQVAENSSSLVKVTNSIFSPKTLTISPIGSYTFVQSNNETSYSLTNCYYTQSLGTVQGIDASEMTAEELVAALGENWEINGGIARPCMGNQSISVATIPDLPFSYPYTGSSIDITYHVYDAAGNLLTKGTHYTATITNSKGETVTQVSDVDSYMLTLNGIGSYQGSMKRRFFVGQVFDLSTIDTPDFEYALQDGTILVGTLDGSVYPNVRITVEHEATIILNNANILGAPVNSNTGLQAGLTCVGEATILLEKGTTNTIRGFWYSHPGIRPFPGHTLTIDGEGTLNSMANYTDNASQSGAAGLGGGRNKDCGNILIKGGTVNATGNMRGPGIGSGYGATCGNITIEGGTVNATGGDWGAGIGNAEFGKCGNILITGGNVTSIAGEIAAGIGDGFSGVCASVTISTSITSVYARRSEYGDYPIGWGGNTNEIPSRCGPVIAGCTFDEEGNPVGGYRDSKKIRGWSYFVYSNTIVFDPNGGTGTMDEQNVVTALGSPDIYQNYYRVFVPLNPNTFTREGYAFMGWNTKADGSGTIIPDKKAIETLSSTPGDRVTLYAQWIAGGSGDSEDDPIIIDSKEKWDEVAENISSGYDLNGKYFKLIDDISVTTMMGTSAHSFNAHFDGSGKTLNVNLSGEGGVAPFNYINGATIKNLKVTGKVTGSNQHTGGLVGFAGINANTIQNCLVSDTLNVHQLGGGIVGHAQSSNTTLIGCVFDGPIINTASGTSGNYAVGGLVGWCNNNASLTFTDCLFAGTYDQGESGIGFHPIAVKNAGANVTSTDENTYYRVNPNPDTDDNFVTTTAKYARKIVGGPYVTVELAHPEPVVYDASGLTYYDQCIKFKDTFYGFNNVISYAVLSCDLPSGVIFNNYSISGDGNITVNPAGGQYYPYSITFPSTGDDDVVVSANITESDWAGSGTLEDPYVITTCAQLDFLANLVNRIKSEGLHGTYFTLGNDIAYDPNSLTDGSNYTPIGGYNDDIEPGYSFRGHFDGQSHTISGIRIVRNGNNSLTDSYLGLFGRLGNGAVVKDVTLADADITGYRHVGGIAGTNKGGTVSNCHVTSSVYIRGVVNNNSSHGGIVGENECDNEGELINTVQNCTSAVTLISTGSNPTMYGAIVGSNYVPYENMDNNYLHNNLAIGATVPAVSDNAYGAIVGANRGGAFSNNYYYNCKVGSDVVVSSGVGCSNFNFSNYQYHQCDIADSDGAVPGYLITLGENITSNAAVIATYHVAIEGATVTLGYENQEHGFMVTYQVNGEPIDGNTFTMPAEAVSVTAIGTVPAWDGDGNTEETAYQIQYPSQLDKLASDVNSGTSYSGKYFKLMNDLTYHYTGEANENNYTAIGKRLNEFAGHFDGNHKIINGIRINKSGNTSEDERQGLFGQLGSGGVVKNLTLTDAVITGYNFVGGMVGYNDGTITNCQVTSSVVICTAQNGSTEHGGIVGRNYNNGVVRYCISAATLTNDGYTGCNYYGGIAGSNGESFYQKGVLRDNLAIGATIPDAISHYGAIAGKNYSNNSLEFMNNYYVNITVDTMIVIKGNGCDGADVVENDGAMPGNVRTVLGYGEETDKWVFMASPIVDGMAPNNVKNLVGEEIKEEELPTGVYNYDLYRFNQGADKEWENHHLHSFLIENGQGYLYAKQSNVDLTFDGDFNLNEEKTIELAYTEGRPLAGYNLVGNPFPRAAWANRSYYIMNAEGTGLVADAVLSSTPIPPCTGVMMQAEEAGQSVTFSIAEPEQQNAVNNGSLHIALTQSVATQGEVETKLLDNAIVSFNEGEQLGKFYFGTQDANIYLPQNGKDYAIASVGTDVARNVSTEIPINFKANENGTYTLSVNPEGVEMDYLHLIDNFTGADVDLLAVNGGDAINRINGGDAINRINGGDAKHCVSTYTFEAKTTDLESRFKLVFAANNENGPSTGSGAFAFISNGNIVVNGEGTLQVLDVMGRVIRVCTDVARNVSTQGMPAGVYVLRLINGDNVKTQKIVIR